MRAMHRETLAWFTYPALMGGFLALTGWGLARGYDPARWGAALAVANFFTLLGAEQLLPRNPRMNVFRDWQSWNDMGHGVLLAAIARPAGSALSVVLMAELAKLRALDPAGAVWPVDAAFPLQLALGLALWTFSDYWIHRALHSFDPPDRCALGEMGLADSPVPPGLLAQLAFPFRAPRRVPQPLASGR